MIGIFFIFNATYFWFLYLLINNINFEVMKILKITLSILLIGFLMSCQKENLFDSDKNVTRRFENSNQLTGKWTLVNISGGIVGASDNFQPGWITWEFKENNHQLKVIENVPTATVYITYGLESGNYTYTNNTTPSNCENNFESLTINNQFESCYKITNNTLVIDNNQIADGFKFTLIRFEECGTPSELNYLVFGHFYGYCGGETCIEKFKLTSDKIYENTNDVYPGVTPLTPPNYVQLSNEKFLAAQDLMNFFPNSLLAEINTTIGMPDASDGGGLYIEYHFNGIHKTFLIDQFKINVPSDYHVFMDKVNEKIALMQ
jgi:hypothetical protein